MSGTKLYCVIGQPLGHSLSPLIHNQAFAETGTEGVYLAFPQTEEHLAAFFEAMRILPISGCNITLPFKVRSMDYVDRVSERARRVGAINTVYWQDGALVGENTDVTGFMAPLLGRKFRQALVLGAGGVSRAALAALQELGLERICLANRSHDRALELAAEFGTDCVPWEQRGEVNCDLVVNATSLGMKGAREDDTPYEAGFFTGRTGLAYDIVYTPEQTRFLREAAAAGWQTQSGVAMFVEQARAAFALWTGVPMPAESAYAAVRRALAERG
ncbi:MAG TPA: shikimate dehydrogenase [Candidatus Desulfovibrio intestinipullorum]|uniref:Shikimate dehydrogenase (NADP(+)) n=1 Tax=Candidatus Desulfovibrio intestinipullorum TaxID=2838536 RepID=A0A9D1PXJ8_9BACT|nr:shikimate dehydrogenase [Candidatus Desulfovibrio intestinipullorum]